MERRLVTRRGVEVLTTLTDEEAIQGLRALAQAKGRGSFAMDLSLKANQYGLSPDQMTWAHKLVIEAQGAAAPAALSFPAIVRLLNRAVDAGLRWPKVRLVTEGGTNVVLSVAGAQSRTPGVVHVADGAPFGSGGAYWGRIAPDGTWAPRRATSEVVGALKALEADPASVAKVQGRLTSQCCFCGRGLDTRESVGVGYGPVCADRFGLPWGEVHSYEALKAAALEEVRSA